LLHCARKKKKETFDLALGGGREREVRGQSAYFLERSTAEKEGEEIELEKKKTRRHSRLFYCQRRGKRAETRLFEIRKRKFSLMKGMEKGRSHTIARSRKEKKASNFLRLLERTGGEANPPFSRKRKNAKVWTTVPDDEGKKKGKEKKTSSARHQEKGLTPPKGKNGKKNTQSPKRKEKEKEERSATICAIHIEKGDRIFLGKQAARTPRKKKVEARHRPLN